MASCDFFYSIYSYLLLLSFSRIWKELSRKYYNAYSDINGKTVNEYAVTNLH